MKFKLKSLNVIFSSIFFNHHIFLKVTVSLVKKFLIVDHVCGDYSIIYFLCPPRLIFIGKNCCKY